MRSTIPTRREFLRTTVAAAAAAGSPRLRAQAEARTSEAATAGTSAKRVFAAVFAYETNTFHPVKTTSYNYSKIDPDEFDLEAWRDSGLVIVPGIAARPAGGGTIDGKACREAMDKVAESLRAALPVDAVLKLLAERGALAKPSGE